MKTITFPDDFVKTNHNIIPGAYHWLLYDDKGKPIISVVGGPNGCGLYGNGITTFEFWDLREDNLREYMTIDDINNYLKEYPIINTVIVLTTCPICNKVTDVIVPEEGYDAWKNGTVIQVALPDVPVDQREMLISGICPKCWDDIFNDEGFDGDDSDIQ